MSQSTSQLERRAEERMHRAIEVARTTPAADIPVGAVIYGPDGTEIATGTNRRETDQDPAGHAEVVATRNAARALGTWRMDGCELVVTLEPCTMCAGIILGSRMRSLVFGAYESKTGAVGSLIDVLRDPAHLHTVEVRGGVLEADTAQLMTRFFGPLR